jgi:gliding motility-associated-like protein
LDKWSFCWQRLYWSSCHIIIVKTAFFVILIFSSGYGWSQSFPVTGQLASTAFPVCGSDTFKQAIVPGGKTHSLEVPGCTTDGVVYEDLNPFWYTFTCYVSGSLAFLITPNNLGDDYDWMLYDITNHNPSEVYTNASLIVTGNWAGTFGLTGAKAGGSTKIGCASNPVDNHSTFSSMPNLIQGHKYLLLISHYTDDSQSGYSLSFGGGSAVITDTTVGHLISADMHCDRKSLVVALNKAMRCGSVAPDGSDFIIPSSPLSIVRADGINCSSSFDMDSVLITLNAPLPPGDYSVISKVGTDDNTLTDDCGNQLPVGENIPFTVSPPHTTAVDSLTAPTCAPTTLQLVFSDLIQCSSISPDGSDFTVSGGSAVNIISARGDCLNGGLTSVINIILSSPVVAGGNYRVTLKTGSDGNTIINECGVETPAGGTISFAIKDTVSASFDYKLDLGCNYDTIHINYLPANGVDQWQWIVDTVAASSLLDPDIVESVFGPKTVQHIVSNGFCSDTVTEIVNLDNLIKASFQAPNEVCPKDAVTINNTSIGHLVSWSWSFGDGETSTNQNPTSHLFPNTAAGKTYTVSLVVQDNLGCYDTTTQQVVKLQSCYITVPNAFTPNGDGKNDYLYPLNGFLATNLEFQVFNRYGQLVFETRDWSKKWDGTIGGRPQQTGTYMWTLRYTDGPSGKNFFLRGASVLIR